jgi:hypothetical protein
MGRPPKKAEDKRQILTFRLDSVARRKVEEAATANDRSVSAELEARLTATLDLDSSGLDLVQQIASELKVVSALVGKPTWHKTLTGWAAAREMLANGPISNFRPERGEDDPAANEVYARLIELRADRVGIVRELTAMGVMVTEEPTKGILNASGRAFARSFIEGAPESPERANAISKFAKLEELDRQIDEADAEWVAHLQIYWEAEWKGRDIYRERLRDLARKAADEGRPYHSEHLFGHWK